MPKFTVKTKFVFEGTFTVKAKDRADAHQLINDSCGLVLGCNIHSTLGDDDIDWDFDMHPEKVISVPKLLPGKKYSSVVTDEWLEGLAESHLEGWKDRYMGWRKTDVFNDLRLNHDDSLEIEHTERELERKLTERERNGLVDRFHKAIVKNFFKY